MPSEMSTVRGDQSLEDLGRELAEEREQRAATAEILRVISTSPMELQRVFAMIAAAAARLCDAYDAIIGQVDGNRLRLVAHHGPITTTAPVGQATLPLTRGTSLACAVLDRQAIHLPDLQAETGEYPQGRDLALRHGLRTVLHQPLIRAGEAIGVISVRRAEVRPFADRQIALLQTFADQAVIAIENTRLFEAEQASKRELQESLEYQTAISDVLSVISRSPSDLQPVLQAIVETAVRLCQADFADFRLLQDGLYLIAATTTQETIHVKKLRADPIAPGRDSVVGRAALERHTVHVPDAQADPEYTYRMVGQLGPVRTLLGVPLVRDDVAVGVIVLFNRTVRPFTQKQIGLVTTFADQALIAIENTRLFEEVQSRTRELTDALEQQTATSEVLSVISSSPTDTQPVFSAIARNAVRLCNAMFGAVFSYDGRLVHFVAGHQVTEDRIRPVHPEHG